MYKRILLAYGGSLEGRTALREGALLACQQIVVAPDCGLTYLPRGIVYGKMCAWSRAAALCGENSPRVDRFFGKQG